MTTMADIKRSWDFLSEKRRKESIDEIIEFYRSERNEKIGIIFAENLLDHFLQTIGIDIYNKGIEDSIDHLRGRFEDIKIDMETLLKK